MDMWDWLLDCYTDGSLTIEDLEAAMKSDIEAQHLWEDWTANSIDFIEYVRDEVWPVIQHIRKKEFYE